MASAIAWGAGAWCMAESLDRAVTLNEVSEYEPVAFLDVENVELLGLDTTPIRRRKPPHASPMGVFPSPEYLWDERTTLSRRPLRGDCTPDAGISSSTASLYCSSPSRQLSKPTKQPAHDETVPILLEGVFPSAGWETSTKSFNNDALELLLAPGDLLVVPPSDGTGRLRLCLSLPRRIRHQSAEAQSLSMIWPSSNIGPASGAVAEIWSIRSLESSRRQPGFREIQTLLFVDRGAGIAGSLTVVGELDELGEVAVARHEVVSIWQSPLELRMQLRLDLMMQTVTDMGCEEVDLNSITATCSLLRPPQLSSRIDATMQLAEIQACWRQAPPIGSGSPFVAIAFWQRYLCRLDKSNSQNAGETDHLEFILRCFPMRADRATLPEFLSMLQSTGWVSMSQLPQLSHPRILTMPDEELSVALFGFDGLRLTTQATPYGHKVAVGKIAAVGRQVSL